MLDADSSAPVRFPAAQPPMLMVVVDTEEEFDWDQPFSRDQTGVGHVRAQARANDLFARFKLRPTYVVDYAVASQEQGYAPLRDWAASGLCDIGVHLHPWVNPPFDEDVSNRNSYPGNLPASLERQKLARLTDLIAERFGFRPSVYRAGRYGVGPNTAQILEDLGYEIDTSVVPRTDFRPFEGPDFSHCGLHPYWFGRARRMLEIPLSVGWTGLLTAIGMPLQRATHSRWGKRLRLQGVLARARLFDRVRLTPEGISLDELRRLTRALAAQGCRVFNLSYHSPSLVPGNTPYVRSDADLRNFLTVIERYLEFFFDEMRGIAATPHEVRAKCLALTERRPAAGERARPAPAA